MRPAASKTEHLPRCKELRANTTKTWRVDQSTLGEILPPAKELPPQAFQSPNGACSRATPVACGRLILRPARLQIEASRSLGNPDLANPGGEGKIEGLLVALHRV